MPAFKLPREWAPENVVGAARERSVSAYANDLACLGPPPVLRADVDTPTAFAAAQQAHTEQTRTVWRRVEEDYKNAFAALNVVALSCLRDVVLDSILEMLQNPEVAATVASAAGNIKEHVLTLNVIAAVRDHVVELVCWMYDTRSGKLRRMYDTRSGELRYPGGRNASKWVRTYWQRMQRDSAGTSPCVTGTGTGVVRPAVPLQPREFFDWMLTRARFYAPDTNAGDKAYEDVVEQMHAYDEQHLETFYEMLQNGVTTSEALTTLAEDAQVRQRVALGASVNARAAQEVADMLRSADVARLCATPAPVPPNWKPTTRVVPVLLLPASGLRPVGRLAWWGELVAHVLRAALTAAGAFMLAHVRLVALASAPASKAAGLAPPPPPLWLFDTVVEFPVGVLGQQQQPTQPTGSDEDPAAPGCPCPPPACKDPKDDVGAWRRYLRAVAQIHLRFGKLVDAVNVGRLGSVSALLSSMHAPLCASALESLEAHVCATGGSGSAQVVALMVSEMHKAHAVLARVVALSHAAADLWRIFCGTLRSEMEHELGILRSASVGVAKGSDAKGSDANASSDAKGSDAKDDTPDTAWFYDGAWLTDALMDAVVGAALRSKAFKEGRTSIPVHLEPGNPVCELMRLHTAGRVADVLSDHVAASLHGGGRDGLSPAAATFLQGAGLFFPACSPLMAPAAALVAHAHEAAVALEFAQFAAREKLPCTTPEEQKAILEAQQFSFVIEAQVLGLPGSPMREWAADARRNPPFMAAVQSVSVWEPPDA